MLLIAQLIPTVPAFILFMVGYLATVFHTIIMEMDIIEFRVLLFLSVKPIITQALGGIMGVQRGQTTRLLIVFLMEIPMALVNLEVVAFLRLALHEIILTAVTFILQTQPSYLAAM